jgi:hypothetical protein
MREAHEKVPMRLVGYCLLADHFRLMLWPGRFEKGDRHRGRSQSPFSNRIVRTAIERFASVGTEWPTYSQQLLYNLHQPM